MKRIHCRSSALRRIGAASLALGLAVWLGCGSGAVAQPHAPVARPTYTNPVSQSFADTFADPSIIHAKDGWWYAYSTADPLRKGDPPGVMHIARTRDFHTWDYQGTVFNNANRPSWATTTSGLWAPDIRYVNGRYLLYFTVTDTTLHPGDDSAIGVATSPTPTGPWTPTSTPVVAPRPAPGGGFLWTFDPAGFTDVHGQRYLYFGSYFGGLWATKVSSDGLTRIGPAKQVAVDNRYEGAYVVRHGRFYYLMGSAANCCAGPTTGYSVFAGRSTSPLGPFVDADGIPLLTSRVGGTIVVTQNGNRWIGAGHHAVFTDTRGQDYLLYHAIDRNQPWLDEPFGINRRPMLIDRLDWIGGWPRARAGSGPSDTPQPAPVTGSRLGIDPADPAAGGFRGLRAGPLDPQAGRTARVAGLASTRRSLPAGGARLRLDLRGGEPLIATLGSWSRPVAVLVDPGRGQLVLTTGRGRSLRLERARIPVGRSSWRTLVVEVRSRGVLVRLSESDLADPLAEIRSGRYSRLAAAPLRLISPNTLVDNLSVQPLATPVTRLAPVPRAGRMLVSENFDGPLSPRWSWVRRDPQATISDGRLSWPVEGADLTGSTNDAGVLLHTTPAGTWIAETKVRLNLGTDQIRNFQQAGMVAYVGDDDFARLSTVAIWNTRQTEFGREVKATADGRTIYGGAVVGTPAPTVWLRLAHTRNAAGEHLYRAGTSRDGVRWTWGAVWTFPAGVHPRIGLVAHGGAAPLTVARFDYLRFYAASWPHGGRRASPGQ